MDMNSITGRSFSNYTVGEKLENGDWKVKVTIVEALQWKDGEVKEETIEAECQASDFNVAQQEALASALYELNEVVLSKGYTSLVIAREEQDDSKAETDETTPTQ